MLELPSVLEEIMLENIHLRNFKCFLDLSLELNNLTILSGINGVGKSSVIQALLVLRQSSQQNTVSFRSLSLNGELVNLGTAKDVLFSDAEEDKIEFEISFGGNEKAFWSFDYNAQSDVLSGVDFSQPESLCQSSLFTDTFQYIQAERMGPRRFFEMSDFQVNQHRQLGTKGEYTAHYLSIFATSEQIADPALSNPAEPSLNLLQQVEAWLSEISPGTRIRINPNPEMDLVNLQFSFGGGNNYRATNVGFGITYTLPVIVAILTARPGALIIIENPEAHLHPKGQAQMGELIARAASIGIQIIVETHSDHVLNGIRLAVHSGRLNPDDATLHFFQHRQNPSTPIVVSPKIDRNGRIDQWPDGFFDEWDRSLEALLDPAGE
jgi:predicted ATPase